MIELNFFKSPNLSIPLTIATPLKTTHAEITNITHSIEDEVNLHNLAFKTQGFHNKYVAIATE